MGELFAGWRFVIPRLTSGWRLLSMTAVGVVLAATLLAAVPIYADSLAELGLQFRLDRRLEGQRVNSLRIVEPLFLGTAVDQARRDAVSAVFDASAGWLAPDERLAEERSPLLELEFTEQQATGPDGGVVVHRRWNAFLFSLAGFEQRVTVIAGRLPGADGGGLEVVLLDGFQQHAVVGDVIRLRADGFDDCDRVPPSQDPDIARQETRCERTISVSRTMSATVVGFVEPIDPEHPFWRFYRGSLEVPDVPRYVGEVAPEPEVAAAIDAGEGSMPLFTSEEQLRGPFALAMPYLPMRYRLGVIADVDVLSRGDLERGIEAPELLRQGIEDRLRLTPLISFPVSDAFTFFRSEQAFQQIPLLIILLQVVGIVVYYVAIVASMLVERQAEELSVFRSRGASVGQLVGLYVMEGSAIAVAAAAVGPWLAGRAVAALGYSPTFDVITGGSALPVSITPSAYLLAAAGAAIALVALVIPAFVAARRGIIDAKREQARPPARNILQRYYIDLAVVVLAGGLLWQLNRQGTVFDASAAATGLTANPLLLASPLVFTLAVAALVLRFYPPLLRWVASALSVAGGTAAVLGLRRAARSPAAYSRLLLLLMMAIAVGTFAASYGPTVDRSQTERIRYDAGVDLRGTLLFADPTAIEQTDKVRAIEGVDDAALVYRGDARALNGRPLQLLTVDPGRTASMLWFRDDFADESLDDLMRELESLAPTEGGIELSDDAQAIRVWLLATGSRARTKLWARIRDGDGTHHNVLITELDFAGERELEVPLPDAPRPLAFVGFRISEGQGASIGTKGALYIDDIRTVDAGGEERLLDDFEGGAFTRTWRMFGSSSGGEQFERSEEQASSGASSAKWSWPLGSSISERFLLTSQPIVPIPVIINGAAARRIGAGEGERASIVITDKVVPVDVRAVVEMFPTLHPDSPFVIANFDHVRAVARVLNLRRPQAPNELWVSTDRPLDEQRELLATLRGPGSPMLLTDPLMLQADRLDEVRSDPTLRASGTGILTAAFTAVITLATLGFLVTLVLGARSRILEFAVLRAIGSSPLQILRSMVLEWGVVLAIGMAIGVLLGRRVARVMLSFLDVTERGEPVVPPFLLETDWLTLGAGVGVLVLVAGAGLALAWLWAVRRDLTVELRVTR